MRTILLVLATLLLHGCWFVYIPGSVISSLNDSMTGARGSYCVPETAKIGSRIKLPDGNMGTVKSISGTSNRCTNAQYPIRAELEIEPRRTTPTALE